MTPRTNSQLTRCLRLARLMLHLVLGCAQVGLLFPLYSQDRRGRTIVRWACQLLAILHVHVALRGQLSVEGDPGYIIAANHISWLDIYVLQSVRPIRFVAKSEIRDWPVLGWLCDRTGTLFIERGRRHHTAKINQVMRDVVLAGGIVGLFPEATTSLGDQLKKFHSALFQAVVESGAPLVPAAIRYTDKAGKQSEVVAYVDDMSMGQSLMRIIAEPELYVTLHFAPPISAQGKTRRQLTLEAEDAIASLLYPETKGNQSEKSFDLQASLRSATAPRHSPCRWP